MRKLVALAATLVLVFALSARPANAQSINTPPVVVDRTALTLTYLPYPGAGAGSNTDIAVSYQLNPTWDVLISNVSPPTGGSAFRIGGRYHLRPAPSPSFDTYLTLSYFSGGGPPSVTRFELGAGITQFLAPGLKSYAAVTYISAAAPVNANAYIAANLGVQFDLTRQFALVAGYELPTGFPGGVWLGLNFDFSVR